MGCDILLETRGHLDDIGLLTSKCQHRTVNPLKEKEKEKKKEPLYGNY